jgi:hypothetical protein
MSAPQRRAKREARQTALAYEAMILKRYRELLAAEREAKAALDAEKGKA